MIKLKVPLTDDLDKIQEMKRWCLDYCSRNEFYFFPQKLALDEPARFWFGAEADALAFTFRYSESEEYKDEPRTDSGPNQV